MKKKLRKRLFMGILIFLELLFVACAISVVVYKILGIFDFGFLSYRFFNIVLSILFIGYLIYGLAKAHKNILILITIFSLFHFIEGIIIIFWFKAVIHLTILIVVGGYYLKHKTLILKR